MARPLSILSNLRSADRDSASVAAATPAIASHNATLRIALTLLYTRRRAIGTQWFLPDTNPYLLVRTTTERDYPAMARIQQLCPEAAQWPVGDYSGYQTLLALADSVPAGFCAWRQTSPHEAELLNLAVDPGWRRRGVASALLAALAKAATGDIFLEVAEPNGPAIALYTRLGWQRTGVRRGYYHHGTINAVVMKKRSW